MDDYANTLTSWLHREARRKRKQRLSVKQLMHTTSNRKIFVMLSIDYLA